MSDALSDVKVELHLNTNRFVDALCKRGRTNYQPNWFSDRSIVIWK